jgi:hypothetical protein
VRAFIIRPFGTKSGIDFDAVERDLIDPALKTLELEGRTTGEIVRAGNIREDMFQLLLTADVVIADISIHNANAFYELGIRHALRAQRTFLINAGADEVPFDLKTDRYLKYDKDKPAASVKALVDGLRATIDTEVTDSPVFKLLGPGLIPQDLSRFLVPPDDFRQEVNRAAKDGRTGDLALHAEEARRLPWAREGLRRVGNAQFDLKSWEPALLTWEAVRADDADDVEANGRLATIYQRLKKLTEADEAVERVLANREIQGSERAELQALRASNMKRRWQEDWSKLDNPLERGEAALRSGWLRRSYDEYARGFASDRNHFYSGLNALAMLTILLELSTRYPEPWAAKWDSDEEAESARRRLERDREQLAGAVELSRQSAHRHAEFTGRPDKWLDISTADLACLMNATPARVADRYRTALVDAQPFHLDAARQQLEIFQKLNVLTDRATASLAVIDELQAQLPQGAPIAGTPARVLLFTGHRLDATDRVAKGGAPRFPAAAESEARRMIAEAIGAEREAAGGELVGIAGGASGGDIIFHETCEALDIKTQLFVVGSRDAYVQASVQDGGPEWVERFNALWERLPSRVLGDSQGSLDLPRWLRPAKDYSVWERSNRWMLNNALVYGAKTVTLLALWNGEAGDGPGGTKDMVDTARACSAKVVVLDAKPLATIASPS